MPSAEWFIRLPFAAAFLYHGAGKLLAPLQSAALLQLPASLLVVVGIAEILVGLGALAGELPAMPRRQMIDRLAALVAIPVLIGAIALVHFPRYSFTPSPTHPLGGMEYQLLLLGVALWLLTRRTGV